MRESVSRERFPVPRPVGPAGEQWELDTHPEGERQEMIDLYVRKGIAVEDATLIMDTLMKVRASGALPGRTNCAGGEGVEVVSSKRLMCAPEVGFSPPSSFTDIDFSVSFPKKICVGAGAWAQDSRLCDISVFFMLGTLR